MIKFVKVASYLICAVFIYSFVGGLVYSVHEYFYPGISAWCDSCVKDNGSTWVAALWPVGVPVWLAVEGGKIFVDIGKSLAGELIDE